MVKAVLKLLGLLLFCLLVVLGIVFVPDNFMGQIRQKVDLVVGYVEKEAVQRAPGVMQEVSKKAEETRKDIVGLAASLKEKISPFIGNWIAGYFNNVKTGQ